ncbi:uncharacterized protein [Drosophila pseudoobscura]|uniref:DUF4806 domain-containing protein n=1 Tax=Drosophila pseudoobscura pseudoobscura TaxID=46245 RepID=A0A6I8WBZ0_DROPS|nr:uncharacterized protein LOC117185092 [Drosophila pseudoobscura]
MNNLDKKMDLMLNKLDGINNLDKKMDIMINKLDRNTAEMVALRSEIGSIKAKVCGEIRKPKVVLPCQPLTTIDELDHFEHNLQEESFFKNVIAELMMSGEKAFDKWIRSSWRSIVSDEVARQCSWRGTEEKKCIRGLRITLAIRTGFKERFSLEDADFDRIPQKFFQHDQDRVSKEKKQIKFNSLI